ncbi:MAG: aminotransferase class I/II-fold pyridoxal phosphate-dependent enzyme, partial [Mycobacteriaceae bacterium]
MTSVPLSFEIPGSERLSPEALRYHGDDDVTPDLVDFAVNVHDVAPPVWLHDRLVLRLKSLGRYPGVVDAARACAEVARRHGREPESVLLLAGAAEGFSLLPKLLPRLVALVQPSFTEPELVFRQANIPITQVVLPAPFVFAPQLVPEEADLVLLGNPTNPTSITHSRKDILDLRRPGRIIVVDEAFADTAVQEPQSLAAVNDPAIVVIRSLTKTWSLAGLRAGYLLAAP